VTGGSGRRPRVILTRASEHNAILAERLNLAGIDSVEIPMIAIEPPVDGGNALEAAVAGFDFYHWLVVTSANGVLAVAKMLDAIDESMPAHLRVAAVGPGTAQAARQCGWSVDFVPTRATALDLVSEFPAAPDDGRPIKVVAALAELGGATVKKGLMERGYQVDSVVAYRTVAPGPSDDPMAEQALVSSIRSADAIAFTSPSTVARFVKRFGREVVPPVVVCIGPRTAKRAAQLDLAVAEVAEPHTEDGLFDAMARILNP